MAGKAHFELFLSIDKSPRFRLRAPNGEIVLQSESYSSREMMEKGIEAIRKYAREAETQDLIGS